MITVRIRKEETYLGKVSEREKEKRKG